MSTVSGPPQTPSVYAAAEIELNRDYEQLQHAANTLSDDLGTAGRDAAPIDNALDDAQFASRETLSSARMSTQSPLCSQLDTLTGAVDDADRVLRSLGPDAFTVASDAQSVRGSALKVERDLAALLELEPGYAGGGPYPLLGVLRLGLSDDERAGTEAVSSMNSLIDHVNGADGQAHSLAVGTSQAVGCPARVPGPPAAVAHIS